MKNSRGRTKRPKSGRGGVFAACLLGTLAAVSTFSCSHNSENQGANAPSGTAGGDNTSMGTGGSGATGGTTNTMDTGPAGGTTSTGTGGSGATPTQ